MQHCVYVWELHSLSSTPTQVSKDYYAYLVVRLDVEFDLFPGERAYSVTTLVSPNGFARIKS